MKNILRGSRLERPTKGNDGRPLSATIVGAFYRMEHTPDSRHGTTDYDGMIVVAAIKNVDVR